MTLDTLVFALALSAAVFLAVWILQAFDPKDISCACGYLQMSKVYGLDGPAAIGAAAADLSAQCPRCQARSTDPIPTPILAPTSILAPTVREGVDSATTRPDVGRAICPPPQSEAII